MKFTTVTGLCALLLTTACLDTKAPGAKPDVTGGMADKEQRLLRVAGATKAAGDINGAKKIYQQVIDISKESVLAHLEMASILAAEGKSTEALEVLKAAEKLQPKNTEVLKELANTMITLNNPTDALVKIDKAITLSSDDPRFYNTKGIAHDMKDERKEAQEAYKKGIALSPETTGYIENNLAMSYLMSRNLPEAIALLVKLADSPQATPTMRQNLALAYGLAGNSSKSLEWSLKDLPEEKAQQNQEIYAKLADTSQLFVIPDTSVKPVTVIENPLPAKLPELTEAQKETLKNAVQFMKTGKPQDLGTDITPAAGTKKTVEEKSAASVTNEKVAETDATEEKKPDVTAMKEEKAPESEKSEEEKPAPAPEVKAVTPETKPATPNMDSDEEVDAGDTEVFAPSDTKKPVSQ